VVGDQFLEIFPRSLEHQQKHNHLLCPVARLQEVVRFEKSIMYLVRKPLVHARGVEVPYRRPAHDPQPKWSVHAKVQCRVKLLHEPTLFRARFDAITEGDWTNEALHEKLAGEAQHDDVETNKGKVAGAFAVHCRAIGIGAGLTWERVGEEYGGGNGIRFGGVYEVERDDGECEDER
jgi:hypothetical protein